jgi:hypothetical protein
MEIKISPKQVRAINWNIGDILEDCRHESATRGGQFVIFDADADDVGKLSLRLMDAEERVVVAEISSRIVR